MSVLAGALPTTIVLGVFLIGCDKGPTTPSPPAGSRSFRSVALTIDGAEAIQTGIAAPYRARATLSNGAQVEVSAAWTSSDPSVATVDATGSVASLKPGSVRLDASFEGVTASKTVDVVANVDGSWVVWATVRQCDEAGSPATEWWPPCRKGALGWTFKSRLLLVQRPDDPKRITGKFNLAGMETSYFGHCESWAYWSEVALTGRVSAGDLSLEGAVSSPDTRWTLRVQSGLVAPGELHGKWTLEYSAPSARTFWELQTSSTSGRHECDGPAPIAR